MPTDKLHQLTIHEAHMLLKQRKISSLDLTKSVLKRIAEIEGKVHTCVTIAEDMALKEAGKVDSYIKTDHEITHQDGPRNYSLSRHPYLNQRRHMHQRDKNYL